MANIVIMALVFCVLAWVGLSESLWLLWGLVGAVVGYAFELSRQQVKRDARIAELEQRINSMSLAIVSKSAILDPRVSAAAPDHPISSSHAAAQSTPSIPIDKLSSRQLPLPQTPVSNTLGIESRLVDARLIKLGKTILDFFKRGNPFVRIGVVVMLIGLGFLLQYASASDMLPLELRLIAVLSVGALMLWLGFKTRSRAGAYGLVLQGGGIATIYLVIFAAAKLLGWQSSWVFFVMMLATAAAGCALAVRQKAEPLAIMSSLDGFMTPLLLGEATPNPAGLMGFYLILNLAVVALAWFNAWRLLNAFAFCITYGVIGIWVATQYKSDYYAVTQGFIALFFVLFVTIAWLYSLRQPPKFKGWVDSSLVFGTPLLTLAIQTRLTDHFAQGVATSALILGLIYLLIAALVSQRFTTSHRLLTRAFIAIGIGGITLSIPLALGAHWTSATWALEAIGLVWIGLRQAERLVRYAGFLLLLGAIVALTFMTSQAGEEISVFAGGEFNTALTGLASIAIALLLSRNPETTGLNERRLSHGAAHLGWLFWCLSALSWLYDHYQHDGVAGIWLVYVSASFMLLHYCLKRFSLAAFSTLGLWLTIFALAAAFCMWLEASLPFSKENLLGVLFWLCAQYIYLHSLDSEQRFHDKQRGWLHSVTLWWLSGLSLLDINLRSHVYAMDAPLVMFLVFMALALPLAGLLALLSRSNWPLVAHRYWFQKIIPLPWAFGLVLLFLVTLHESSDGYYILPVVNLMDAIQLGILTVLFFAFKKRAAGFNFISKNIGRVSLATLSFIWINWVLLRALHHYADVPFSSAELWNSTLVQMSLSILWVSVAAAAMFLSRRFDQRDLWLAGAGLVAVILLKLFINDIADRDTLFQVISFMAVGATIAAIGYVAPIPGKSDKAP